MKKVFTALSAVLLATSMATASISPYAAISHSTEDLATVMNAPQIAFAKDCDDSIWKFSLIEALTCLFSGQWG